MIYASICICMYLYNLINDISYLISDYLDMESIHDISDKYHRLSVGISDNSQDMI